MIQWENVSQKEKETYMKRSKEYVEKGYYQGFTEEELAIFLYRNKDNESE
jgi:hypothetical protein